MQSRNGVCCSRAAPFRSVSNAPVAELEYASALHADGLTGLCRFKSGREHHISDTIDTRLAPPRASTNIAYVPMSPSKPVKKRGPEAERLVVPPTQVRSVLDRLLETRPAKAKPRGMKGRAKPKRS